ncbi:unnamed protein product [Ectocarpus sp. 8 AP-2014]
MVVEQSSFESRCRGGAISPPLTVNSCCLIALHFILLGRPYRRLQVLHDDHEKHYNRLFEIDRWIRCVILRKKHNNNNNKQQRTLQSNPVPIEDLLGLITASISFSATIEKKKSCRTRVLHFSLGLRLDSRNSSEKRKKNLPTYFPSSFARSTSA